MLLGGIDDIKIDLIAVFHRIIGQRVGACFTVSGIGDLMLTLRVAVEMYALDLSGADGRDLDPRLCAELHADGIGRLLIIAAVESDRRAGGAGRDGDVILIGVV